MNIDNIIKSYDTNNVVALNGISYSFKKGKFYAIVGKSGSGKTTLLNILGLMDKPTSGKYELDEKDVFSLNDKEQSNFRMSKIGFVFQDFYLDENLTAIENVILPMINNKSIKRSERIDNAKSLLDRFELKDRYNHFLSELSGGEKQRVCLARALANKPDYILCDEPTGNLDEENETIIFNYLKKLADSGKCVIVVSHSKEITKYADVIINIKKGEIE